MRIIYGDHKDDLRRYLRPLLVERERELPCFVLVPDRRKLETERHLLDARDSGCLLATEVLSFSRFAYRFAAEMGIRTRPSLSEQFRALLFHEILAAAPEAYRGFGPLIYQPQFLPELANQIQEFRRYDLEPQDLRRLAIEQREAGDPELALQSEDLASILEAYRRETRERGYMDAVDHVEALENQLRRLLAWQQAGGPGDRDAASGRASFLSRYTIVVTGFGEQQALTLREARILTLLDALCAGVLVTLQMPGLPTEPEEGPEDDLIFAPARLSWERLRDAGAAMDYLNLGEGDGPHRKLALGLRSIEEDGGDEDLLEAPEAEAAEGAEASETPGEAGTREMPTHRFYRFPDADAEIRYILGDLQAQATRTGRPYRDFAIAVADPSLLPSLERVARDIHLPIYLDQPVELRESLPVTGLKALFDLILHGLRLPELMTYLRHPLVRRPGVSDATLDHFENFCLARGISGYRVDDARRYHREWPKAFREEGAPREIATELDPLYAFQKEALLPVRRLEGFFVEGVTQSRRERLVALRDYLQASGWEEQVRELTRTFNQDESIHLVKSWNNLLSWLAELAARTGEIEETPEIFIDAFLAGLEAGEMETIPSGVDQVLVTNLVNAAQGHFYGLYLMGASSDNFPGQRAQEQLFKASERRQLRALLDLELPDPELEDERQGAAIVYNCLSQVSEILVLSHHSGEELDPEVLPVLEACVPGFEAVAVGRQVTPAIRDARLHFAPWALSYFAQAEARQLSSPVERQAWAGLFGALEEAEPSLLSELEQSFARARRVLEPNAERQIDPELMRQRLGDFPIFSASQLERYAACPYAYFMDYVLRLEEREIWEPRNTNVGEFMHGLLEHSMAILIEDFERAASDAERQALYEKWQTMPLDPLLDLAYARLLLAKPELRLFSEPEYRVSVTRLARRRSLRSLEDQRVLDLRTRPLVTEWRFGGPGPGEFVPTLDSAMGPFGLRGLVDRIDVSLDEPGLLSIRDYKSSQHTFEAWSFLSGQDLQLPLYALARERYAQVMGLDERVASAAWVDLNLEKTRLAPDAPWPDAQAWEEARRKAASQKVQSIEGALGERADWGAIFARTRDAAAHWVTKIRAGEMPASSVRGPGGSDRPHCEFCEHRAACRLRDPIASGRDYRDASYRARARLGELQRAEEEA